VEKGKSPTCALFKGIGKMLDWENVGLGFHIYIKRLEVGKGNQWVACGLLKWYGDLWVVCGLHRKGGGKWGYGGV
jgi:hypothetical protein